VPLHRRIQLVRFVVPQVQDIQDRPRRKTGIPNRFLSPSSLQLPQRLLPLPGASCTSPKYSFPTATPVHSSFSNPSRAFPPAGNLIVVESISSRSSSSHPERIDAAPPSAVRTDHQTRESRARITSTCAVAPAHPACVLLHPPKSHNSLSRT